VTAKLRLLCYVLLAIGLLVAVLSASQRLAADRQNRTLMLLVDWQELNALPEPHGQLVRFGGDAAVDPWDPDRAALRLLKQLPENTQVCYSEETVGDLVRAGILRPAQITANGPTFTCFHRYARDVAAGAERHGYPYEQSAAAGGQLVVQFPAASEEELNQLPLAWRSDTIEALRATGFGLILRPGATEHYSADGLRETLAFAADQPLMLFRGTRVPGFPGSLDEVAAQITAQQQAFGWVEFDDQDGGGALAQRLVGKGPGIVRVHSIPAEEMEKYTTKTAVERLLRAASERGIRCLYLRPFAGGTALDEVPESAGGFSARLQALNSAYFDRLVAALKQADFSVGATASVLREPPGWLRTVRGLAIVPAIAAGLCLLLALWLPGLGPRTYMVLLALGILGAVAAMAVDTLATLALLVCGIVFPLLGFFTALRLYQRMVQPAPAWSPLRLAWGLAALVVASVLSVAGGILIHGAMWDVRSMLHITQYRGVTIALALPMLLLAAYAWESETLQDAYDRGTGRLSDYWLRFTTLWQAPIRYGDVAFILIAVGALGVVLLRSGNEGPIGALSVESWFRGALEDSLSLRPRTKELLGHPLLVLFLLSLPLRNRLSLLLGLGGLLGQVSILNTFCHLHTPLGITLTRVVLGVGLGILSALVWGAVMLAVNWVVTRNRERHEQPPLEEKLAAGL
jgi:hypothetical protein